MRIATFFTLAFSVPAILAAILVLYIMDSVARDNMETFTQNIASLALEWIEAEADPALAADHLSRRIDRVAQRIGAIGFILDEENRLIAHPLIATRLEKPPLDLSADEVLFSLPSLPSQATVLHQLGDEVYGIAIRPFSKRPTWRVGLYIQQPVELLNLQAKYRVALIGAAAVLPVALILAIFLSRQLSRPLKKIGVAASRVRDFDLDIEPLEASRLIELNETSNAFNAMTQGLRQFERYVPKALVHRLMNDPEAGLGQVREITVLFTDMVDFSTWAQGRPPEEVRSLLNEHLAVISDAIEANGGTVDKFIGDSVMAFWNAPEDQPDHAARATAAALAIRQAIKTFNQQTSHPIGIRVGLHTGEAISGNIGSSTRLGYSVIGETVNVAARLEQLGREFQSEDDVVILASRNTVDTAEYKGGSNVGARDVKGGKDAVEVYRL